MILVFLDGHWYREQMAFWLGNAGSSFCHPGVTWFLDGGQLTANALLSSVENTLDIVLGTGGVAATADCDGGRIEMVLITHV